MTTTQFKLKGVRVSEDIILRVAAVEFAASLFALTNANRRHLRRWLPWLDNIACKQDSVHFIEHSARLKEQGKGLQFLIFYRGQLCGVAGFHSCDFIFRRADIGYWLAEKFTGKGIMTRTVRALIRFGYEQLELRRISIRCATSNTKSRQIPERLGFKLESTRKQCEWLYDHYVDHAVYSLSAKEYRIRHSSKLLLSNKEHSLQ